MPGVFGRIVYAPLIPASAHVSMKHMVPAVRLLRSISSICCWDNNRGSTLHDAEKCNMWTHRVGDGSSCSRKHVESALTSMSKARENSFCAWSNAAQFYWWPLWQYAACTSALPRINISTPQSIESERRRNTQLCRRWQRNRKRCE